MLRKISEAIYMKTGIELPPRAVKLLLVLSVSLVLFLVSIFYRISVGGFGSSNEPPPPLPEEIPMN